MRSPRDRLVDAIDAWRQDDATETVARWRADPDASPPAQIHARHARLRGPRARELFEEASDRELLVLDERSAVAEDLRAAQLAPARARSAQREADAWAMRVPHDSDHHAPLALLSRSMLEPHPGRRRLAARSLELFFHELANARRDGRADEQEAAEGAAWLDPVPPTLDRGPEDLASEADAILGATDDAWMEISDRLAHDVGAPIESWLDLAHALRSARWDGLFDPPRRWRRIGARLEPLGLGGALASSVRIEPRGTLALRDDRVLVLRGPRDLRIGPGPERGLTSERSATIAVGRALAIALSSPAHPTPLARPRAGTVGRAIGGLLFHLHADPRLTDSRLADHSLDTVSRRSLRERALALELASLRTLAAAELARVELDASSFDEHAREHLRRAWGVDVAPSLAACLALSRSPHPDAPLRAARWVGPLALALREQLDEDWWRNPRTAEVLRAAFSRGPTLSVEAWADELGADPNGWAARLRELLG